MENTQSIDYQSLIQKLALPTIRMYRYVAEESGLAIANTPENISAIASFPKQDCPYPNHPDIEKKAE